MAAPTKEFWSLDIAQIEEALDALDAAKVSKGIEFKGQFRVWENRWYKVKFSEDMNAHVVVI